MRKNIARKGRRYRRRYKAKRQLAKRTTRVNKQFGFINPRTVVRLKYVESFNVSLSTNSFSEFVYNLNSIFDPNQTGSGHQPYGYDQLALLYNRYRVFAGSWTVIVGPTNDVCYVTTVPVNGSYTFAAYDDSTEVPRSFTKVTSVGSTPIYIRGRINLPKLVGVKTSEYKDDDRFQSQFGTSPTESIRLHVLFDNPSASVSITARVQVHMFFYVECFDPILQSPS